ncbi:EKC/KEOPS complex subunit Tprkb-like [Danaus plexippus]|uniref:EKC/KEOPS complex subunit Tprkb-like n=1 Tax=Danaus plexippus TaxID=13037 RepID=UPI002AAF4EB2|nr:EKC/KEOPS complex subunit Tprkb-like [Danaus plexippus]
MSSNVYSCPLDPETLQSLKIYLFKDVKNVEDIRNNVIKGVWKCAVIKPSLIVDVFQVVVAANRAVLSKKSNNMVTKTVYSEILYNLSLTKNITQSLSKFGIEKDNNILICFLVDGEDESESIVKEIQGEACPISELRTLTNMKEVKSVYKLNNIKTEIDYLDVIVSRMVTKNFVSH